MNEKITLPSLTQLLALRSGDSKKQAEDFLKEFFGLISSTIVDGEQIKVKDLGVFKTTTVEARKSVNVSTGEEHHIPSHRKVVFVPSKELAALINEPFEMFETVELVDDNIELTPQSDEDLEDFVDSSTDEVAPEVTAQATDEPQSTEEPDVTSESTVKPQSTEESEVLYTVEEETVSDVRPSEIEPEIQSETEKTEQPLAPQAPPHTEPQTESIESEVEDIEPAKKSNFWPGVLCGVIALLLIECVIWLSIGYVKGNLFPWNTDQNPSVVVATPATPADPIPDSVVDAVGETETVTQVKEPTGEEANPTAKATTEADDVKEDVAPTAPSDQKVYDTITKTRYLTTMAKDHYGNYHLWPYIYEENKSFLGHPDRIKPGTKVVIPDLKKYGVNPNNPDDIAKAKKKGIQIYSKYK